MTFDHFLLITGLFWTLQINYEQWNSKSHCELLSEGSGSSHRSTTLLVGLPVSFVIMAVRFNERKHGGFPWRFNGISFLFKSRITGSKQSSILLGLGLVHVIQDEIVNWTGKVPVVVPSTSIRLYKI